MAKKTDHSKPARKAAFKDPIMDGMRFIAKALEPASEKDRKFLLDWAQDRFGSSK